MIKHQIDSKAGAVLLIMLLTGYSCGDSSPEHALTAKDTAKTVSEDDTRHEIERLEQSIKAAKIKNLAIKKENEELISRKKGLESRILELQKTLNQKEDGSVNQ